MHNSTKPNVIVASNIPHFNHLMDLDALMLCRKMWFAFVRCTWRVVSSDTFCMFVLGLYHEKRSMLQVATDYSISSIAGSLLHNQAIQAVSMLQVATDYSISSIARSLLHNQAVQANDMEGNLIGHLVDECFTVCQCEYY
jgi:hypothetical protein